MKLADFKILTKLEKQGVYIHTSIEHYPDGSNLNFSIEFRKHGKGKQTSWYGDNHEYGDIGRTMSCAVRLAQFYLEDPNRIEAINYGVHEDAYKYVEQTSFFIHELTTDEWKEDVKKFK